MHSQKEDSHCHGHENVQRALDDSNPSLKVIKRFSCSSQLTMKFQLVVRTKMLKNTDFSRFQFSDVLFIMLMNVKIPTNVGI